MPFIAPFLIGAAIGAMATWAYLKQQTQNAAKVDDGIEIELEAQAVNVTTAADSQATPDSEATA